MKNILMVFICTLTFLFINLPATAYAEKVGVFYDFKVEQIKFAAGDVKSALESKNFTVEMLPLASLKKDYANKKVVITLATDKTIIKHLLTQGVSIITGLGEQAYCLRTTSKPEKSFWIIAGDGNGAMYGGLQIAENIKFKGFSETYNNEEAPAILKRGIKLNFPFDKENPTYGKTNKGGFEGTSYKTAIPNVWDMTFWTEWFDEMARNRYNTVSLWSCHPFTCLVKMEDYPDVAIQNVSGFDGFSKKMSIDEKIEFWQKVMKYAHNRGFEFLLFNWNVFTYGATGKYGITEMADNPATKLYTYKSMIKLLETYPDLDGFGVTNGENKSTQEFLWETYGKGMYDYALAHPTRKLRFIHRWHWAKLGEIKKGFDPLISLPNVTFDMSYKYSVAHMYSAPAPSWMTDDKADKELRENDLKTWLTVRNDEMYYHNWGDPDFARTYVNGMIGVGKDIFRGFYMGSDGYCPTRDYVSKNDIAKGKLDVQRQWYMYMLWGRLSYNPKTSDEVFSNQLAFRYPTVSTDKLFSAWKIASSTIPKITELVQGTWKIDLNWWIEACTSKDGFRTIQDFAKCKVAKGSILCSISNSAADSCFAKKSSYQLADEIEKDALSALELIKNIDANTEELGVALNNIKAMSYMTIYYAYKIRGATYLKANQKEKAQMAMGKAYCWWMTYTNLMEKTYNAMDMQRVKNLISWRMYDDAVLKEYTDLGGVGVPQCAN